MTASSAFSPALVLILGGLLLPLLRGHARSVAALVLPLLTVWLVWQMPDGVSTSAHFLGYRIEMVKADALGRLFALIFAIMAFAGALFALNQPRVAELAAGFVSAGSAIGIALAGDLITLFVFWEVMAVASTVVVWSRGSEESYRASMRYLQVHLLGGVLLMAGIVAQVAENRHHCLYGDDAEHAGDLAHSRRLPHQRRGAAPVGVAAGRLPGGVIQWNRASFRPSPPRRRSMCCCGAFPAPKF